MLAQAAGRAAASLMLQRPQMAAQAATLSRHIMALARSAALLVRQPEVRSHQAKFIGLDLAGVVVTAIRLESAARVV